MIGLRQAICASIFVAALATTAAYAGPPKDSLLDHMTGHWVLAGTIDGKKTVHDIDAQWTLQGTYLRLTEMAREKDASGKPKYEAEVLIAYDAAKSHYVCFWYDTEGVAPFDAQGGVAVRRGDTLPFLFRTRQGNFHTTFTYQSKTDTWTWAMDGEVKGKLVPFARVVLKKR